MKWRLMDYPIRTPDQLTHVLKGVRSKKKLSQAVVGARIGLKQEAISTLECGPGAASLDRVLGLLSALGLELVVRDIPEPPAKSQGEW